MSSQPLVSVVIPSYNHAQYVQESIQSIIDQDYENIELIIIDDGSKDNSIKAINEMIEACQKRFVRFEFRHRPNKGLCATLNEAIDWMDGEFFSALASDDIALMNKVSFSITKFCKADLDVVFGVVEEFSSELSLATSLKSHINHNFIDVILQKNIPQAPTAVIRLSSLRAVGCFDSSLILEDWYLWLKMLEYGFGLVTYPVVTARYRRHIGNTTNDILKMHNGRKQVLKLFYNNEYYKVAMDNEYKLHALRLAEYKVIAPIVCLIRLRKLDLTTAYTLLKTFTPRFLITYTRKSRLLRAVSSN